MGLDELVSPCRTIATSISVQVDAVRIARFGVLSPFKTTQLVSLDIIGKGSFLVLKHRSVRPVGAGIGRGRRSERDGRRYALVSSALKSLFLVSGITS